MKVPHATNIQDAPCQKPLIVNTMIIPTTVTATNANTMTLTFGSAVAGKAMIGLGGGSTADGRTYVHAQSTGAVNWQVTHSLGEQYPAVTVYDEADNVIIPSRINAVSINNAEVFFEDATSGNAHFSVGNGIPGITSANAGNFIRVAPNGKNLEFTSANTDVSGSFEVTGSFTLEGDAVITGSLFVTGSRIDLHDGKNNVAVGKDSLSMATSWKDKLGKEQSVISPLSLIVSAFAPLRDVSMALTPQINLKSYNSTELIFIDLGKGKQRMGGSIVSQITSQLTGTVPDVECVDEMPELVRVFYQLIKKGKILSYHDRSDGGLICSLVEMAFASRSGLDIKIDDICNSENAILKTLFNEELGIVIQVASEYAKEVRDSIAKVGFVEHVHRIGSPNNSKKVKLWLDKKLIFEWDLEELLKEWNLVSYKLQSLRDNPETAKKEYLFDINVKRKGINPKVSFVMPKKIKSLKDKPPIAILREQGVNGQVEMAAAFDRVGFSCVDVHMTDLILGKRNLNEFRGLVACGGFSYGDVLGAGKGWATNILYNETLRKDFREFFSRSDVFSLGVCNGCQMLAFLSDLIPESSLWPEFIRNKSEKFEARFSQLLIGSSPSIFFKDMNDSVLPIAVAHGEGQINLSREETNKLFEEGLVPITYADDEGRTTESYPQNPNGSIRGVAGVTNLSGTITLMMPHPERSFLSIQNSWKHNDWGLYSPWIKFFLNAREFIN